MQQSVEDWLSTSEIVTPIIVYMVTAHDDSLLGVVDFFPDTLMIRNGRTEQRMGVEVSEEFELESS